MEAGVLSLALNIVLIIVTWASTRDRNRFRMEFEEFRAQTEREKRDDELHAKTLTVVPEMVKVFAEQNRVLEEMGGILRGSPSRHDATVNTIRDAAAQARQQRQSIQATQSEMHKVLQALPAATERALHPSFKQIPTETNDLISPRLNELQAVVLVEFNTKMTLIENAMREIQNIPLTIRSSIKLEMEDLKRKCLKAIEDKKPSTEDVSDSAEKVDPKTDDWTDAAADEAA